MIESAQIEAARVRRPEQCSLKHPDCSVQRPMEVSSWCPQAGCCPLLSRQCLCPLLLAPSATLRSGGLGEHTLSCCTARSHLDSERPQLWTSPSNPGPWSLHSLEGLAPCYKSRVNRINRSKLMPSPTSTPPAPACCTGWLRE